MSEQIFKKYGSIGQFRNWVHTVKHDLQYAGQDADGQPIYNLSGKLPTVSIVGTVKIHGTNAGIVYKDGELYAQKKEGLLTLLKDNYGFCNYVMKNKSAIIQWIKSNTDASTVVIHGEWCGQGIQKKVAIAKLSKRFIFFKVSEGDIDEWTAAPDLNIFNIRHFKMFALDVDMNYPGLIIPTMEKLTEEVDLLCPVAERFGVEGHGEGIVWEAMGHKFKVKGENHTGGGGQKPARTRVTVTPEKLESIKEFVDYCLTESRLFQGLEHVKSLEITEMAGYIKWIIGDVMKEESDTMLASNLSAKDVNKYIATGARVFFTAQCDKAVFG